MRKIIAIAACCLPLVAFAQIQKGKSVLSGSLNYSVSGVKNDPPPQLSKIYQFGVSASYGYMIGDRWAVGITPGYTKNTTYGYGSHNHHASFEIGPFARRYFAVGEKFFLHLDGGMSATFNQQWIRMDGENGDKSKTSAMNFYIKPGASYFLSDRIALQASLGNISYGTAEPNSEIKQYNFTANFGFSSFVLGAAWYF